MFSATQKFTMGRIARDLQAALHYPSWLLQGKTAPDNHNYKKRRIARLAKEHQCVAFIETGTFYGQMVNFARQHFETTISIEIFEPFQSKNAQIFAEDKSVHILLGDSATSLHKAISLTKGRILFWLDGHYSGAGTGIGEKVSPIIEELRLIAQAGRHDHCIAIDDRRLFVGQDGYPTLDETLVELKRINPSYTIEIDQDSIVASPPRD